MSDAIVDAQVGLGTVTAEMYGPDGELLYSTVTHNLITQVGDQVYVERGAGLAGAPAAPTGMKLGTGSTAPAKTGAGAALVTYLTGSAKALDAAAVSSLSGSSRRITYTTTWGPGVATTASAITEVVLVNEAITDATSAAAATVARALLSGVGSKDAGNTLIVAWSHDWLGS